MSEPRRYEFVSVAPSEPKPEALCKGCGKPFTSPDFDPRCSSCVESGTGPEAVRPMDGELIATIRDGLAHNKLLSQVALLEHGPVDRARDALSELERRLDRG